MSLVPKHIKKLKPYVAGKSKKEFKRKFGDRDSIKLASNENPLGCPPKSIQRVQIHINNCNRYPDSSGFELREKLANKYDLFQNCCCKLYEISSNFQVYLKSKFI